MKRGGDVIVSNFGPEGPTKSSGLEVVRYDPEALHQEFGVVFACRITARNPPHTVRYVPAVSLLSLQDRVNFERKRHGISTQHNCA
jgi:hypothetical protein